MVFLSSIHSDAVALRSSFYDPESFDDDFAITVDEPLGGPAVTTVAGRIDAGTAPVLDEFLGEAVLAGRPVVLDLLGTAAADTPGLRVLDGLSRCLRDSRVRATIVCSEKLQQRLTAASIDIACYTSVARAVTASMSHVPSTAATATATTDRRRPVLTREDACDALRGTYL